MTIQNLKQKSNIKRKIQRGLSLVEIAIVIVLIGIVYYLLLSGVGGADLQQNRASAMVRHMQIMRTAVDSQGQILGCYPQNVAAMVTETTFNLANGNTCQELNPDISARFHPPYIRNVGQDGQGVILDDIMPGARGELAVNFPTAGNPRAWIRYEIRGLTLLEATLIWRICNHLDAAANPPAALNVVSTDFNQPCYITGGRTAPRPGILIARDL